MIFASFGTQNTNWRQGLFNLEKQNGWYTDKVLSSNYDNDSILAIQHIFIFGEGKQQFQMGNIEVQALCGDEAVMY